MHSYDLLIFGATKNTGLLLAQQAQAQGFRVAAVKRATSDIGALVDLNIDTFEADAFELEACKKVIQKTQPRWVVSVLGGKDAQGKRVDAQGNINVINAATHHPKIERFLLLTSMGCGDQYENSSAQVKQFLGEALRAKTLAEIALQESHLPWTIIRPCGLNHDTATGIFHLLEQPKNEYETYMPRADVATAVLKALHEKQWLHKVLSVQGRLKQKDRHDES